MTAAGHLLGGVLGAALIVVILIEVFETIVLPRRVTRRLRLVHLLYRSTWDPWRWGAAHVAGPGRREGVLSIYGPLSLLLMLALWGGGLIVGFAALQWSIGTPLSAPEHPPTFGTTLYFSSTTFFTLGLGDITPRGGPARLLTALEAAGGFGVLGLVIGYLPTLYQAFSRREIAVSLLDARAGSPPSAAELLRRYAEDGHWNDLDGYLREWEEWAAELMESHLSYPMLAYFRSQHDNQSWLAAITTILDTCALVLAGLPGGPTRTARLTFAMGRHAIVDLAQIFYTAPTPPQPDRLAADDLLALRQFMSAAGLTLAEGDAMEQKLTWLRASYEPYINALSRRLMLPLPLWLPSAKVTENWRSTVWEPGGRSIF